MEFYNELNYLQNLTDPKDEKKKVVISIGQCFELYNLMGCDEKQELKGIKEKKDELKEDGDDNEDEEFQRFVIKPEDDKPKPKPKPKPRPKY